MPDSNCTVLLVEEDYSGLASALASAAPEVHLSVAASRDEAKHCILGTGHYADRDLHPNPQLILLDLELTQQTGFELLAWLKCESELKQIPVVALTSSRDSEDVDRAYAMGANSCLLKRFEDEALREVACGIGDYAALLGRSLAQDAAV